MTTVHTAAARRVSCQLDTLRDCDYEPTGHELESLDETAKKSQGTGSTTLDWSRPIGTGGQFLHGTRGARLVARQLVDPVPELDSSLYTPTQVVDEGRHVEIFERDAKRLGPVSSRVEPRCRGIGLLD
jgi:hypothetical protein